MRKQKKILHSGIILIGVLCMSLVLFNAVRFSRVLESDVKKAKEDGIRISQVVEGDIVDRNGLAVMTPTDILAENTTELGLPYSYLVGYRHSALGSSGLRYTYSEHLFDDDGTGKGGTVQLTVDDYFQQKAYNLLKKDDLAGAIIIMDARNGELLAMTSRRGVDLDFNKYNREKEKEYQKVTDRRGNKNLFLDPAVCDGDAPGSVFKVVTATAAINAGKQDFLYTDTGVLELTDGGKPIHNAYSAPLGEIGLETALVHSSNTYFGSLALELGEKELTNTAGDFLVGKPIDLGFATLTSNIAFDGTQSMLAQTGFGQGRLAISPLHLAMIGQSIVNDGTMYAPYVVKALHDAKGRTVYEERGKRVLASPTTPETAAEIKRMMRSVTLGNNQRILMAEGKYGDVYSKTGTAQLVDDGTLYHSYLLCMTDEYVVLISVNDTQRFGGQQVSVAESLFRDLYADQEEE